MKRICLIILAVVAFSLSLSATNPSENNSNKTFLNIDWAGGQAIVDSDLILYVNGECIGTYSYLDGFRVKCPLSKEVMEVKIIIKLGPVKRKSECKFFVNKQNNYTLMIMPNNPLNILDLFGFNLVNNDTNEMVKLKNL